MMSHFTIGFEFRQCWRKVGILNATVGGHAVHSHQRSMHRQNESLPAYVSTTYL